MATQILPDEEMIADSDKLLTFTAYDSSGSVINITGGNVLWLLSPSGDSTHMILEKEGTILSPTTQGKFTVFLDDTDTIGLDGEYIQQIMVRDSNSLPSRNTFTYAYRNAQGRFLIHPAIWEGS